MPSSCPKRARGRLARGRCQECHCSPCGRLAAGWLCEGWGVRVPRSGWGALGEGVAGWRGSHHDETPPLAAPGLESERWPAAPGRGSARLSGCKARAQRLHRLAMCGGWSRLARPVGRRHSPAESSTCALADRRWRGDVVGAGGGGGVAAAGEGGHRAAGRGCCRKLAKPEWAGQRSRVDDGRSSGGG